MKPYEGLFIFPPEATADARKNQIQNLDDLIRKFEGAVLQKTELGKKLLGYPLKKNREGYLLVVDFQMNPAKATEFRKVLEIQEDILSFMITIKSSKAEKKPAKVKTAPAKSSPASSAGAGSQTVTTH